jgi:hypothetical protein
MPYDKGKLIEKISTIQINTNKNLQELNTRFLFNYEIFPTYIMKYLTQWTFEKRNMRIGDTIIQETFLPPFKYLSQKILFGVRINEIINENFRVGFSYETLIVHVEKGISTFTIEKNHEKQLLFKVHTFSRPGNILTNLLGPIFSIPYQTYCTKQALLNVKRQLENS